LYPGFTVEGRYGKIFMTKMRVQPEGYRQMPVGRGGEVFPRHVFKNFQKLLYNVYGEVMTMTNIATRRAERRATVAVRAIVGILS
jgi:hypothetical protein